MYLLASTHFHCEMQCAIATLFPQDRIATWSMCGHAKPRLIYALHACSGMRIRTKIDSEVVVCGHEVVSWTNMKAQSQEQLQQEQHLEEASTTICTSRDVSSRGHFAVGGRCSCRSGCGRTMTMQQGPVVQHTLGHRPNVPMQYYFLRRASRQLVGLLCRRHWVFLAMQQHAPSASQQGGPSST